MNCIYDGEIRALDNRFAGAVERCENFTFSYDHPTFKEWTAKFSQKYQDYLSKCGISMPNFNILAPELSVYLQIIYRPSFASETGTIAIKFVRLPGDGLTVEVEPSW